MGDGTSAIPGYGAGTDPDCGAFQWDTREDCEVRQILDRLADKWSLLVIALLDVERMRFTVIKRKIDGVSQRMLAQTLRHLERDGLVTRTVHATVPPRVDYELTEMGRSLHATVQALVTWTEAHQSRIAAARDAYDLRVVDEHSSAARAQSERDRIARGVLAGTIKPPAFDRA